MLLAKVQVVEGGEDGLARAGRGDDEVAIVAAELALGLDFVEEGALVGEGADGEEVGGRRLVDGGAVALGLDGGGEGRGGRFSVAR